MRTEREREIEPTKMPPVPVESVLNPEPHHQTAPTAISSNRDHSIIRDEFKDICDAQNYPIESLFLV